MKPVGIRELKNRLSYYVRQVKAGEEFQVTDRGEVVAELRLPSVGLAVEPYPGLASLARQGRLRLGGINSPDLYPRSPVSLPEGTAARLLDEEREDRC